MGKFGALRAREGNAMDLRFVVPSYADDYFLKEAARYKSVQWMKVPAQPDTADIRLAHMKDGPVAAMVFAGILRLLARAKSDDGRLYIQGAWLTDTELNAETGLDAKTIQAAIKILSDPKIARLIPEKETGDARADPGQRPGDSRENPRVEKRREEKSAGALQSHSENLERSSAQQPAKVGIGGVDRPANRPPDRLDGQAIAGAIHAGLEANAEAKLREWNRSQASQVLVAALAPMAAQGLVVDADGRQKRNWREEIAKIVEYPHVTPAAAEIAVNRLRARMNNADEDQQQNVIGYLINALGAKRSGGPLEPYETDAAIVDAWAQKARQVFDSERVKLAAQEAGRRIDEGRRRLESAPVLPPTPAHFTPSAPRASTVAGA